MPAASVPQLGNLGFDPDFVAEIVASWSEEGLSERVSSFCQLSRVEDQEWPTRTSLNERLRRGIYSTIQLLAWEAQKKTQERTEIEYPFCFSLIGLLFETFLSQLSGDTVLDAWPGDYDEIRRLLQALFALREAREEGEPMSLEVVLPEEKHAAVTLGTKRLAQVFGRGVAATQGNLLWTLPDGEGGLSRIYDKHDTAPAAMLYHLGTPFDHIKPHQLSFALRRDGHFTIAAKQNPIVEFYNGGWHIVDIKAGRSALANLLDARFPEERPGRILKDVLINLAYHMATHWHPGILAVVDVAEAPGANILEPPTEDSKKITSAILEASETNDSTIGVKLIMDKGLGRVLLTSAIQDGATVFTPDGSFHSAGRMVRIPEALSVGGAGTRAAKGLANHGVAIKVSKDGPIKIFAKSGLQELVPAEGLRIH